MKSYTFPGRVRELENIILNAVVKTFSETHINSIDLPKEYLRPIKNGNNHKPRLTTLDRTAEKQILNIIKTVGNNVQSAGPLLGVSERILSIKVELFR